MMLMFSITMSAQTAIENPKLLDNTYVGGFVGAGTPLDLNAMFPLNGFAGVKVGKDITPLFGVEVEGAAFVNDNHFGRWTNTFVKGTNVSLNGTLNISNLVWGYKGTPRKVEVKTNTGLGWMHLWKSGGVNELTAKTGVDVALNLGKSRRHTVFVTPAVYWNMTANDKVQFNKNRAQLTLAVGYAYHFKTSNGTHAFKTYDISAYERTIADLNAQLAKKPTEVVVEKVVEKVVNNTDVVANPFYVPFAFDSAVLTNNAKATLDNVVNTFANTNAEVNVLGYATSEGTKEYNLALSQRRAEAVAEYLRASNVKVNEVTGLGVSGDDSQRCAVVVKR